MDRIQFGLLIGLIISISIEFVATYNNQTAIIGVMGIFIGIVLGSLVSYSIETYTNRKKVRFDHLFDIKQKCLEKIMGNVTDFQRRFEFNEPLPKSAEIQTSLNSPFHWWDKENSEYYFLRDTDRGLYKDLNIHKITKEIPSKVEYVRGRMSLAYHNFLIQYVALYNVVSAKVSGDSGIASTKKDNYTEALVRVAMGEGDDFRHWSTAYNTVQRDGLSSNLDTDSAIVLRYRESKNFIKARKKGLHILKNVGDTLDTILDSYELNDDCKYVKAKV